MECVDIFLMFTPAMYNYLLLLGGLKAVKKNVKTNVLKTDNCRQESHGQNYKMYKLPVKL